MKIGIYPGSFDPMHLGHIQIINKILEEKIVDKVLVVPTGNYWDKNITTSIEDRINMVKLISSDSILVEERDNQIKATYDFLQIKQLEYKKAELWLIIGGDNVERIHKWINYMRLIEYPFIVVGREGFDKKYIEKKFKNLNKRNYVVLNMPNIDISSTYIRENINNKEKIESMLDSKIYQYIQDHKLYK